MKSQEDGMKINAARDSRGYVNFLPLLIVRFFCPKPYILSFLGALSKMPILMQNCPMCPKSVQNLEVGPKLVILGPICPTLGGLRGKKCTVLAIP